ncbi:unnamed protein product [Triticum turgidum subsp. durum]|uniref:PSI subunit V n=1 Tax=Triticum turgidum subsp. durum TaxID=4567 RepID=A0A9R1RWU7_TRITD|nr:unnamed protein product [Triticum turgidum subsp. durum]
MATAYAPPMASGLVCSKPRGLSGDVPGGPTHQRRPAHRQPGDAGHLQPPRRLVPLQPPRVPHRRQPAPPRHRGRPRPRLPPRRPLRAHRPAPQQPRARPGGNPRRHRPRLHPQRLPHHVRCRLLSFIEGAPALTLTGRKKEADKLQTAQGWSQFTGGFFSGGVSGAVWAYFLLYVLDLPYFFK